MSQAAPRRSGRPLRKRSESAPPARPGDGRWIAPLAIVAAAAVAYHNIFAAPFVFDDIGHIEKNPAIQRLWPLGALFANTSRPVVRLSLALDHAISGLEVWSYHLTNLAIHAGAGLALHALIRRTLERGPWPRLAAAAPGVALAATLLWVVHPLQTEAVTYTIQRGESLASLFYLLVLLAVARSADAPSSRVWPAAAVVLSLLGMATKPVMATAPLMALAYDRIFLAGSFSKLWRERGVLHGALLATIGIIPVLLSAAPLEWRYSSGLGLVEFTPRSYAMTEPGVLLHYLKLALWPHPLCIDYGWPAARGAAAIVTPALGVGAIVVATVVLLARKPALGFVGLWFLLILAPTSSVIPLQDAAFEHRLYLPLAALAVLVALGGFATLAGTRNARQAGLMATALAVAVLTVVTVRRNVDYQSAVALWTQTVAVRPQQPRARVNLAYALDRQGRTAEASRQLDLALERDPRYPSAHLAKGFFLARTGAFEAALPHVRRAAEGLPMDGEAQYLYGTVLSELGEVDAAIGALSESVRLEPWRAAAHNNLGLALVRRGEPAQAIPHLRYALAAGPPLPQAHYNLALAYAQLGDSAEVRRELEGTLALDPNHAGARAMMDSLARRAR